MGVARYKNGRGYFQFLITIMSAPAAGVAGEAALLERSNLLDEVKEREKVPFHFINLNTR